jgi:hypothetical protein
MPAWRSSASCARKVPMICSARPTVFVVLMPKPYHADPAVNVAKAAELAYMVMRRHRQV